MLTRAVTSRDHLPLTYYCFGDGNEQLVLVNPPGMSVRFWLPVIAELRNRYRIVVAEYRGFPECAGELTSEQATFASCVDDLETLLDVERIEQANFATWCAGTSLVLALHERRSGAVRSVAALGLGTAESEPSQYFATIGDIERAVSEDPACVPRMLTMMKRTGILRPAAFFEAFGATHDSVAARYPALATLPFMMFDSEIGLRNYLRLFQQFAANDRPLRDFAGPVLLIDACSSENAVTAGNIARIWPGRENASALTLPIESQFLTLERAGEVAGALTAHFERHPSAAIDQDRFPRQRAETSRGA